MKKRSLWLMNFGLVIEGKTWILVNVVDSWNDKEEEVKSRFWGEEAEYVEAFNPNGRTVALRDLNTNVRLVQVQGIVGVWGFPGIKDKIRKGLSR